MEFRDHRPYAPGDDVRHLDWNVFLRSGELAVKTFTREDAPEVLVILDRSASMGPAGSAQDGRSREIAAALLFLATSAGGTARLLVPEAAALRPVGAWSGLRESWNAVETVAGLPPPAGSPDPAAVDRVERRRGSPRFVAWVTDLLVEPIATRSFAAIAAAGQAACLFLVMAHDDAILDVPAGDAARLVDPESGREVVVESTAAWRAALTKARTDHVDSVLALAVEHGIRATTVVAHDAFETVVATALLGGRPW